jgi:hypothetical protein
VVGSSAATWPAVSIEGAAVRHRVARVSRKVHQHQADLRGVGNWPGAGAVVAAIAMSSGSRDEHRSRSSTRARSTRRIRSSCLRPNARGAASRNRAPRRRSPPKLGRAKWLPRAFGGPRHADHREQDVVEIVGDPRASVPIDSIF